MTDGNASQFVIYQSEDGQIKLDVRFVDETVWLTQLEMAELFDATKQNIALHLKNLFADGELNPAATVKESLTVQVEVGHAATTDEYSVVQLPEKKQNQWRTCHG